MAVLALVVERRLLLHQPGQRLRVERRTIRLRHVEHGLGEIDQMPAVAVGHGDAGDPRRLVERQAAPDLLLGTLQERFERLMAEPFQHQHLGPRQQGRVEREGRILRGRADQRDRAVLHHRQKAVLLGAVEAVDLVDEQERPAARLTPGTGLLERLLQVGDAGEDRRHLDELEPCLVGQQAGDGGLAGPGRPPQDHRADMPRGEHARQGTLWPEQMVLADDAIEALRPHQVGQRARRARLQTGRLEQVGHR